MGLLGEKPLAHRRRIGIGGGLSQVAFISILAAVGPLWLPQHSAWAQLLPPEVRNAFLSSPLDDEPLDPLLPTPPVRRPLSPLEQYQLEQDLDELALLAEALTAGEDVPIEPEPDDELPTPTDLWMREVRLRRLLGIEKELQAIRRVAQWMRDRASTQQLQLLAARLREIQQDVDPNPSTDEALLLELAEIYAILGEVSDATNIYRSLADQALAEGDEAALQNRLETLAGLQSAWFYFDDAAATYGELLQLTQLEPNREIEYLKARSHNLEQAEDFSAAVVSQQRLLEIYNQNEPLWTLVPALQHNLGKNYLALGDQTEASRYFRSAYTNALDQSQLSLAAASIRSLANIYTTAERWDDVRYLYEQLILVEQRANNAFGLMETFDSLGQLYEQLEQPGEALTAYREGLIMARSLNHREDYFEAQIARLMGEGDESVGG